MSLFNWKKISVIVTGSLLGAVCFAQPQQTFTDRQLQNPALGYSASTLNLLYASSRSISPLARQFDDQPLTGIGIGGFWNGFWGQAASGIGGQKVDPSLWLNFTLNRLVGENLHLGLSLETRKANDSRSYNVSVGSVHHIFLIKDRQQKIQWLPSMSFSSMLGIHWQHQILSLLTVQPALMIQLLRVSFFSLSIFQQIDISRNWLQQFSSSVGFSFFEILHLKYGIIGEDFLLHDLDFLGASLGYDWGAFSFQAGARLADPSFGENWKLSSLDFQVSASLQFSQGSSAYQVKKKLVHIFEPEKLITPDGDGRADVLKIHLKHLSLKKLRGWNLIVKDKQGNIVCAIQPHPDEVKSDGYLPFPELISWNALNFKNQRVADAAYALELLTADEIGQINTFDLGEINVDSKNPDFNYILEKTEYVLTDKFNFQFSVKDKGRDIVEYLMQWRNIAGDMIYEEKFSSTANEDYITNIRWNGLINPAKKIEEGRYSVTVSAIDRAGNNATKKIGNVMILDSREKLDIEVPYRYFSGIAGSRREKLPIYFHIPKDLELVNWRLQIFSLATAKVIRNFDGQGYVPDKVDWDGSSDQKETLLAGEFFIQLFGQSKGNEQYESRRTLVYFDRLSPQIFIKADKDLFTPDGDGKDDTIRFDVQILDDLEIHRYRFVIMSESGQIIRTVEDKTEPGNFFIWDGITDSGDRIGNFENFTVTMEAEDLALNVGYSLPIKIRSGLCINRISNIVNLEKPKLSLQFFNINFNEGSWRPDQSSLQRLAELAVELKKLSLNIKVVGHSDNVGSRQINMELSQQRAKFIGDFLVQQGIEKSRVSFEGKGPDLPLFPNTSAENRQKNRRVEFELAR